MLIKYIIEKYNKPTNYSKINEILLNFIQNFEIIYSFLVLKMSILNIMIILKYLIGFVQK